MTINFHRRRSQGKRTRAEQMPDDMRNQLY